ncbi:MAG: HupE/UreJ family protein [Chitinophagaceae bacterium]|nr:HupE/UreJ family protein [Chitinophagaceae bacterium]
MSNFSLFFRLGIEHITDLNGIDHILFILALCLRYVFGDWKKLLVLVTAFTIGHSITLALSTLNMISVPRALTEFLIAVTIIIAAISNMFFVYREEKGFRFIYVSALLFGLIHGLGFSSMLKSMLGKGQNIIVQLLGFNLGLEVGQLIIVAVILGVSFIFVNRLRTAKRDFVLVISGAITALALEMAIQRFPY